MNDVRLETTGMQRKRLGSWKQYAGREFFGEFPQDPPENHRKKSGKFPTGILLQWNRRNVSEPAVSMPECSTWVAIKKSQILIEHQYSQVVYLENGSSVWPETLGLFLALMWVSTVKIWAESVRSIEERSAANGRGLRAMPPRVLGIYKFVRN